jgi:sterol desaturase/sphingolipid hydroxylase (fatty acid hydroxylase superfamily)
LASVKDPTVVAIPFYFGTMGLEYLWLRDKPERPEATLLGYERSDTIASLTMGVGSLVLPLVMPKLLGPFVPGKGRYGRHVVAIAAGAALATTVADRVARRSDGDDERSRRRRRVARRVAKTTGVVATVTGITAAATAWTTRTSMSRMWRRRVLPDLGTGPAALVPAVLGWDFVYYWNHRFMHESRCLWAIHVVHHSSEKYNLSTALRQPVADDFGLFVPYSLLALFGIRPSVIQTARGINLLYQFWIHTEAIDRLGKLVESTLNTPSHHRVHHGSNSR